MATLNDLYRVEGKAELVSGKIVQLRSAGILPNRVAMRIAFGLDDYAQRQGGVACGSSNLYTVPKLSSGRESFSPDASYYTGPLPSNPMRFIEGPPTFAAEVRNEE